jgi:hypothetical protein
MAPLGRQRRALGALTVVAALGVLGIACGARTGLPYPEPDAAIEDAGDDAAPVGCKPGQFTLAKARPTVMIVADRSGSMNNRFDANGSRWVVLGNALAKALPPVDPTMRLGLLMFPAAGARNSVSCALPGTVNLVPALNNVQPLVSTLKATTTGGGTPTADAIALAGKAVQAVRSARTARAMILATDGSPNCNSGLDPASCVCSDPGTNCRRDGSLCLDDKRTVDRINDFAVAGVPTYVIGLGNDASAATLDAMAIAGGRPQKSGPHRYYAVANQAELDAALVTVRDQVGACTYLTPSVPDAEGTIRLLIDGKVVPYDPTNGWVWVDQKNGEIVLAGAACDLVSNAPLNVVAEVSCGDDGGVDGAVDAKVDADGGDAGDASAD